MKKVLALGLLFALVFSFIGTRGSAAKSLATSPYPWNCSADNGGIGICSDKGSGSFPYSEQYLASAIANNGVTIYSQAPASLWGDFAYQVIWDPSAPSQYVPTVQLTTWNNGVPTTVVVANGTGYSGTLIQQSGIAAVQVNISTRNINYSQALISVMARWTVNVTQPTPTATSTNTSLPTATTTNTPLPPSTNTPTNTTTPPTSTPTSTATATAVAGEIDCGDFTFPLLNCNAVPYAYNGASPAPLPPTHWSVTNGTWIDSGRPGGNFNGAYMTSSACYNTLTNGWCQVSSVPPSDTIAVKQTVTVPYSGVLHVVFSSWGNVSDEITITIDGVTVLLNNTTSGDKSCGHVAAGSHVFAFVNQGGATGFVLSSVYMVLDSTPTPTFTPTTTPTNTNTPTSTSTSTPFLPGTPPPTLTGTQTPTFTPSVTPTNNPSFSPTLTPVNTPSPVVYVNCSNPGLVPSVYPGPPPNTIVCPPLTGSPQDCGWNPLCYLGGIMGGLFMPQCVGCDVQPMLGTIGKFGISVTWVLTPFYGLETSATTCQGLGSIRIMQAVQTAIPITPQPGTPQPTPPPLTIKPCAVSWFNAYVPHLRDFMGMAMGFGALVWLLKRLQSLFGKEEEPQEPADGIDTTKPGAYD